MNAVTTGSHWIRSGETTMPYDRDDVSQRNSLAGFRKQLIDSTAGVDLDLDGQNLRFSNVPLFRDVDGRSHQAIRVRLAPGPSREISVANGDTTLGTLTTTQRDVAQSDYLLVPEVGAARTVTITVGDRSVEFEITPQRKFSVHLVLHSHYDIGYTDPQSIVNDNQLAYIDNAIELAHATRDWPEESRFRWNVEVNWPLREWLRLRPWAKREEFIALVNEGVIEVNALPFSMHTEAYSHDELAHQLEFTAFLRREYGLEIVSANQTDVPGATLGLVSLLTDAGIRYFTVAHNFAGRSIPFLTDGQALRRPFWWEAPDGDKLLVWYTDTFSGAAYMEAVFQGVHTDYNEFLGSHPEYLNAMTQLPYPFLRDLLHSGGGSHEPVQWTRTPFEHDVVAFRVQSAFADNAAPSLASAEIAKAWNEEWTWPRLHTSTNRIFFADMLERHADGFPTYSGDWTDWWADGIGSAARELGFNRRSQAQIQTSQTLHALADVLTDVPNPHVQSDIQLTYDEMALFDEHTWGSGNPWENQLGSFNSGELQWMHKASFAHRAMERSLLLLNSGLQRIAPFAAAATSREGARSLTVFNPSSWPRTDLVRVFVPEDIRQATAYDVFDAAIGERLPVQIEAQTNRSHRARGVYLHFLAKDIPATGYARYEIVPAEAPAATAQDASTSLQNDRLRVEVDLATAAIASIVDKATDQEIVAANAPFGFNRYIHDRYATAPTFNHLSGRIDNAGPWLLGARGAGQYGLVTHRESNDLWERLTYRYAAQGADWLETTLTLPHGTPRLHIANRLHKPAVLEKESVYYAFPFAGDNPEISLEITGGVAGPDSPHVPGSANHFRAMRYWASVTESGSTPIAWATREAALVQLGTIAIPYPPFISSIEERHIHPATIYSWALNNLWDTNFPAKQGGELTFAYELALGAEGDDAATLGRDTGASIASPLVGVVASSHGEAWTPTAARGSFVTVLDPDVEILHLRQSRDGKGIDVVVQSHAPEVTEARIEFGDLVATSAKVANFLGENPSEVPVANNGASFTIAPGELKLVQLGFD
jgi:hypothetical protein